MKPPQMVSKPKKTRLLLGRSLEIENYDNLQDLINEFKGKDLSKVIIEIEYDFDSKKLYLVDTNLVEVENGDYEEQLKRYNAYVSYKRKYEAWLLSNEKEYAIKLAEKHGLKVSE